MTQNAQTGYPILGVEVSRTMKRSTLYFADKYILQLTLLQKKHVGKYLKLKVVPLTVTQKRFFTF